ncbi:MAG TPA: hypothetical protein VK832_17495, partial [Burkholderiaceae bacterium]|nr:hypothetical protein [Burkholderiaceae bacterium]
LIRGATRPDNLHVHDRYNSGVCRCEISAQTGRLILASIAQQHSIVRQGYGFNSNASMKFRVNGFHFNPDG